MTSYNRVLIVGRLTRDPELRKISTGSSVVTLGLAVTDSYRNAARERVEKACFFDVEVWGDQAENCAKYLKKGRPVLIEGKLQLDEWEDKNGERRQKLKVRAQWVQFLGSDPAAIDQGNGNGNNGGGSSSVGSGSGKRAAQKAQPAGARGGSDDGDTPF